MALPSKFNTVPVHGHYVGLDGAALEGSVTFTATPPAMIDPSELTIIINKPLVIELINGEFTAQLPATDDPDIDPTGFTYKVDEKFNGKNVTGRSYSITVPLSSLPTGIDLSTAAPAVPVVGITRPQTLDELSDVITPTPLAVGAVLVVGSDGVWRPHVLDGSELAHVEVVGSNTWLKNRAGDLDALVTGAITRNSNGAATAAAVTWPDGNSGAYTALVLSSTFLGAVDSYKVTYVVGSVTKTVTQPTVTRDSSGAVTTRPALTVT